MSIFVCCDRSFANSPWATVKFSGINEEAARKRIPVHYVFSRAELEAYRAEYESDPSSLVLISTTNRGIAAWREEYRDLPLATIVFANHDYPLGDGKYSTVMTDIMGTTEDAVAALKSVGCRNIALFGTNRIGGQDRLRVEAFRRVLGDGAPIFDVDSGGGTFAKSFRKMMAYEKPVDGILVAYDYIAFCLIRALDAMAPGWQKHLRLISCGGMAIGELMTPSLSTVSVGFAEGAKEVVSIHRILRANGSIATAHLKIRGRVILRETTAGDPPDGMVFADYRDCTEALIEGVRWALSVEKWETLLTSCDKMDGAILLGIVRGEAVASLTNRLYLSESAIKRRVRGYRALVGVDTARELRERLLAFLGEERLAEYFAELP